MYCMGVVDMAAVCETRDNGNSRPATRAFEPYREYIGDTAEKALGITDPVLVDDHATPRTAAVTGYGPDAIGIPDNEEHCGAWYAVTLLGFFGALLKSCPFYYTIYGHCFS
jgi:hypothetical protein